MGCSCWWCWRLTCWHLTVNDSFTGPVLWTVLTDCRPNGLHADEVLFPSNWASALTTQAVHAVSKTPSQTSFSSLTVSKNALSFNLEFLKVRWQTKRYGEVRSQACFAECADSIPMKSKHETRPVDKLTRKIKLQTNIVITHMALNPSKVSFKISVEEHQLGRVYWVPAEFGVFCFTQYSYYKRPELRPFLFNKCYT